MTHTPIAIGPEFPWRSCQYSGPAFKTMRRPLKMLKASCPILVRRREEVERGRRWAAEEELEWSWSR